MDFGAKKTEPCGMGLGTGLFLAGGVMLRSAVWGGRRLASVLRRMRVAGLALGAEHVSNPELEPAACMR